jgi:hypothetical protein
MYSFLTGIVFGWLFAIALLLFTPLNTVAQRVIIAYLVATTILPTVAISIIRYLSRPRKRAGQDDYQEIV